jgi:hypothetical protein
MASLRPVGRASSSATIPLITRDVALFSLSETFKSQLSTLNRLFLSASSASSAFKFPSYRPPPNPFWNEHLQTSPQVFILKDLQEIHLL